MLFKHRTGKQVKYTCRFFAARFPVQLPNEVNYNVSSMRATLHYIVGASFGNRTPLFMTPELLPNDYNKASIRFLIICLC